MSAYIDVLPAWLRQRTTRMILGGALVAVMVGCESSASTTSSADQHTKADLTVSVAPSFTPLTPSATDTVTINASVNNIGGMTAGSFRWDVSRDSIPGFRTGQISEVPGNSTVPLTFAIQEPLGGTHRYVITLDADNTVDEADESNNSIPLTINVSGTSADVMISGTPSVSPLSPTSLDFISMNITFINQTTGSSPALNVPYQVTNDTDRLVASGVVSFFDANVPVSVQIMLDPQTAGSHTYFINLDPDATITDPDRANNSTNITIVVQPTANG